MNMYNVKVNDTHMCVLRKVENENRVKVDFVELEFKYQSLLDELECMANNPNRTVMEMQDFVMNSPLRLLERDYNFCDFLDGTYQWVTCVQKISRSEYMARIAECEKNNGEACAIQYASDMRHDYFLSIKNHVLPYMIQEKYDELAKDPSVVAFSHRRVGWAAPSFKLNEDLQVDYLTNFGYGMSSYFYSQIYYKGIGILPYSDWVHYYNASTSDIVRYTRRHLLENKEWINAMDVTAKIYNYAMSNPDDFVKHFILNEVEEMVSGLEKILKSSGQYQVIYSFFNKNRALRIEGDELTRFKGEKISGALNFLDQLCRLAPICGSVTSYLNRIMNCNLSVRSELKQVVTSKSVILEKLIEEIEKEQPVWDAINEKLREYNRMREEMYNLLKNEQEFQGMSDMCIRYHIDKRFDEQHKEYLQIKAEYEAESKKYYDLCAKRGKAQQFVQELQTYLDKIEEFKGYIEGKNVAA